MSCCGVAEHPVELVQFLRKEVFHSIMCDLAVVLLHCCAAVLYCAVAMRPAYIPYMY